MEVSNGADAVIAYGQGDRGDRIASDRRGEQRAACLFELLMWVKACGGAMTVPTPAATRRR